MVGKQLYSPQEMQQLHPGDKKRGGGSIAQTVSLFWKFIAVSTDVCCWNAPDAPYAAVCPTPQAIFIAFDASNIVSAEDVSRETP